ncbi:UNVERIFIED_CONTAM: hypothetical protein FKN15_019056, partial [Acipenser sinensis]
EFSTSGSSNTDSGKATGSLETKYKMKELGLTFNQKWNTDNTLSTGVTLEDQLANGLKLTFDTSFVPNTGKKSGKLKTGYKRDYINLGCDVDFDFAGPVIHGAAVVGYEGWLAGYQVAFDTAKSKLAQNNFALGYKAGDFQLHTNVNDGTEFGGSVYQKVNDKLETAVNLAWTAGSNNTRFGIAAKYQLDTWEFSTSGSSNTDSGKATGSLETKYKMKELGLTFNQKWNTDNTLSTGVTLEDQLANGLKLTFDTSFVPNTGKKSGKLKTGYKRDYINLGCDVDFGWLAGYQVAFDTAKSKLAQNNFALGYKAGDFQLHTNVNDGTEFGGSVYQKVNDKLETAVNLAWTAGSNNTRFGIAAKYQLDTDTAISVSTLPLPSPTLPSP